MSNHQPHRKLIYIAGPMSGLPDCNRPAFHAEANHQRERGHIPLNPAILPDGLTQPQYMAICIEMVKMADELLMLPGWRDSQGATAEFHLAIKCGKVIRQAEDGFAWYPTSQEAA